LDEPYNFEKRGIIWKIVGKLEYDYDIHPKTREQLERNYKFYDEVVNKGMFYGRA
jgi:hypothetical protein